MTTPYSMVAPTSPTLDTTEIAVQPVAAAPVAARDATTMFPHTTPIITHQTHADRVEVAASYVAVVLVSISATLLLIGSTLGVLS